MTSDRYHIDALTFKAYSSSPVRMGSRHIQAFGRWSLVSHDAYDVCWVSQCESVYLPYKMWLYSCQCNTIEDPLFFPWGWCTAVCVCSGYQWIIKPVGYIFRAIEGTLRSINNLLEPLHHSFFFYLPVSSMQYVSISIYFPPLGCIFIALVLEVSFTP